MSRLIISAVLVLAFAATGTAQPPLVQYLFDQGGTPTTVINSGSIGGMDPIVGHDLTGISPNGTPALNGVAGSGNQITSGLTVNFGNNDWTIGFGIDTSANNAAFQYTSSATSDWRTFVSGAAGTGNIIIRGPSSTGIPDTVIPGGGGQNGWVHSAWVYDSAANQIRGYLNGSLVVTENAGPLNIVPNAPLVVGNLTTSIQNGTQMEDFRVYDRALPASEVETWACGVLLSAAAAEWETNGPKASVSVDGVSSPANAPGPIIANKALNTTAVVNLDSTLIGNPWDLGVTSPELPVALSNGGAIIGVCPSETVNLDLTASSLFFLNNLAFNNSFTNLIFNVQSASNLDITTQMVVLDPGSVVGLQLSSAVEIHFLSCDNQENFDSLPQGTGNAPFAWTNPSSGVAWTVDAGGTTSSNTGPTAANSLPNYMYCETSGSGGTATFVMDTCDVPLTSLATFTLNFQLSRIGSTIGTLNIWQDDDAAGTFGTLIATYMGADPTQAQGATEWSAESIPFVPAGTSTVAFRFDYTAGGSFTGDIAIDDFDVQ